MNDPLCKNCMKPYCTHCAPAVQRQRDRALLAAPAELVEGLLRHTRLCTCGSSATYARAMCDLCDICAMDPELEWSGYGTNEENKERCLLKQAPLVRRAYAFLREQGKEVP